MNKILVILGVIMRSIVDAYLRLGLVPLDCVGTGDWDDNWGGCPIFGLSLGILGQFCRCT